MTCSDVILIQAVMISVRSEDASLIQTDVNERRERNINLHLNEEHPKR